MRTAKRRVPGEWLPPALLALLGAALYAVPGVRFSARLSLGLAVLWMLGMGLRTWGKRSPAGRRCFRIFAVGLTAAAVVLAVFEAAILLAGERDQSHLPADAVIVLGAGVNGETPSLVLQTRIDAAASYLAANPGIPAVLSGGQGAGESITEAEAMRRTLTARGVDPARLILEEQSTSTAENFRYSKALLEEHGVDTQSTVVAVVTNDFHCFRSHLIARREGLTALDIPAELPWWWLSANYYVREAFALCKTLAT